MKLLTHRQIVQKIERLAIEILERNTEESELVMLGVNNRGMRLAELLHEQITTLSSSPIHLTSIRLSPANPLATEIVVGKPVAALADRPLLIVDDVANTGRTLHYATKPLLEILPKKIEIAVMVDRKHKSFPIRPDYVGLELATTLMENIDVQFEPGDFAVFLTN